MSNEQQATALERPQPQSTGMSLYSQAPNQNTGMATVVPLDRENLTFFANMVKGMGIIPKATSDVPTEMQFYRVMGKIVAGTSYQFDPILSQTCFDVMFNGMHLNAKGQGILFRKSGEYDLRITAHTDKGCSIKVLRRFNGTFEPSIGQFTGGEWREIGIVEFNEDMAKKAGLLTGPNKAMWEKYARDMYYARVLTRTIKRFNPSCLLPAVTLGNYFAKESQPVFQSQTPVPEQLPTEGTNNATSEPTGEEYTDPEYIEGQVEEVAEDQEVEGEVVITDKTREPEAPITEYGGNPVEPSDAKAEFSGPADETTTSEESARVDLVTGIGEYFTEKLGGDAAEIKKFLKGRDLSQMDASALKKLYGDLKAL